MADHLLGIMIYALVNFFNRSCLQMSREQRQGKGGEMVDILIPLLDVNQEMMEMKIVTIKSMKTK